MLRELRIRDFAIIDSLDISFGPGLNVLTGETGAGKSILIGALGLVLGQRAYTELIKSGAESASVEAFFDLPGFAPLGELGIPSDEGVLIRRNVTRQGKGRAYINDTLVSVQSLATVGDALVDVHGQHEHQSLLNVENQLAVLDRFGRLEPEVSSLGGLYDKAAALRRRLDSLASNRRERVQRLDLLRYQVQEIDAAGLHDGEDVRLEEELNLLSNMSRLMELAEESYAALYGDEGSAVERISAALNALRKMGEFDPEAEKSARSLEEAHALAEDSAHSVRDLRQRYDLDPARLGHVQERLETIKALKRKYGETIAGILSLRDDAEAELTELGGEEQASGGLASELEKADAALAKAASQLSAQRKKAAAKLEKEVAAVLKTLALEKAAFNMEFTESSTGPMGMDTVEYMFSANPGEPPKALRKVASGGELSRLMLAVKTVLRGMDDIPVLVFDEVDAGIGGRTAKNVAERLRDSARGRQVICITHLPQIAALADTHCLINKKDAGSGVRVTVTALQGQDREKEIARMLSGKVTDASVRHARELIGT